MTGWRLGGTPIEKVAASDIQALLDLGAPESRFIEYKGELPGRDDEARREFLADASAFANTAGGVILYGIEAEKGIPIAFRDIGGDSDAAMLRLASMLRDALRPSLRVIRHQTVTMPTGDRILVLGIPRSRLAPHAVWFHASGKFFRRTGTGKEQADVDQIRTMFLEQSTWEQEALAFHRSRVVAVSNGETSVRVIPHERTFVHILPLGSLRRHVTLSQFKEADLANCAAWFGIGHTPRFDYDGFLAGDEGPGQQSRDYTLLFRFGGLEVYTSAFHLDPDGDRQSAFSAYTFARWLLDYATSKVPWLIERFGVAAPFGIFITIRDLAGRSLWQRLDRLYGFPNRFTRTDVELPPVVVEDPTVDFAPSIRLSLEVLWQSAGLREAPDPAKLEPGRFR